MRRVWTKRLLATAAGVAAVALLAGCGGPSRSEGSANTEALVGSQAGGIWETAANELNNGWVGAGNEAVVWGTDGQNGLQKLQQAPNSFDISLTGLTPDKAAVAFDEGLIAAIDESRLPELENMPEQVLEGSRVDGELFIVPVSWETETIVYRKDLVPFEITSWADLWRPELKGQVAIPAMPSVAALYMIMAGGAAFGDGPDDWEAGWKAFEELQPNVQYAYQLAGDPIGKLADGSLAAAVTIGDFAVDLEDQNVVIAELDEGYPWVFQGATLTTQSDKVDQAYDYFSFLLSDEAQISWVESTGVSPSNLSVELPQELSDRLVETEEVTNKLWPHDWATLGQAVADNEQRWQQIVG